MIAIVSIRLGLGPGGCVEGLTRHELHDSKYQGVRLGGTCRSLFSLLCICFLF